MHASPYPPIGPKQTLLQCCPVSLLILLCLVPQGKLPAWLCSGVHWTNKLCPQKTDKAKVWLPLMISLTSLLFLGRETTETKLCWLLVLIGLCKNKFNMHEIKQNKIQGSEPGGCVCLLSNHNYVWRMEQSSQNLSSSNLKMISSLPISP